MGLDESLTLQFKDGVWYEIGRVSATFGLSSLTLGGIILGDSTPDAAGEMGYDSNVMKYYDNVGSKTLATTADVAAGTGLVERIGASFDGGGSAIAVNKIAFVHVPYAITTINQWTVVCDQDSGATGIVIEVLLDAYAEDHITHTTICDSDAKMPHTTDGAGAGGTAHQAAWNCGTTAIAADSVIAFKVKVAPTAATWCSVSLKGTR
jgi:hypothetical protein